MKKFTSLLLLFLAGYVGHSALLFQDKWAVSGNNWPTKALCVSTTPVNISFTINENGQSNKDYFQSNDVIAISLPSGFEFATDAYNSTTKAGFKPTLSISNTNEGAASDLIEVLTSLKEGENSMFITLKTVTSGASAVGVDVITFANLPIRAVAANSGGKVAIYLIRNGVNPTLLSNSLTLSSQKVNINVSSNDTDNSIAPGQSITFTANGTEGLSYKFEVLSGGVPVAGQENASNTYVTERSFSSGLYTLKVTGKNTTTSCEDVKEVDFRIVSPSIFKEVGGTALAPQYCSDKGNLTLTFNIDDIVKAGSGISNIRNLKVVASDGVITETLINKASIELPSYQFTIDLAKFAGTGRNVNLEASVDYTFTSSDNNTACYDQCEQQYNDCVRDFCLRYIESGDGRTNPRYEMEPFAMPPDEADCSECDRQRAICRNNCGNNSGSQTLPGSRSGTFKVVRSPAVSWRPTAKESYCNTERDVAYTNLASPLGGTFSIGKYSVDPIDATKEILTPITDPLIVSKAFDGSVFKPSAFSATDLGFGKYSITYTYTENGCPVSIKKDVTITQSPNILIKRENKGQVDDLKIVYCEGEEDVKLKVLLEGSDISEIVAANFKLEPSTLGVPEFIRMDGSDAYLQIRSLPPGYLYKLSYSYLVGTCTAIGTTEFFIEPLPKPYFTGIARNYCAEDPRKETITLRPNDTGYFKIFDLSNNTVVFDNSSVDKPVGDTVIVKTTTSTVNGSDVTVMSFYPSLLPSGTYDIRYHVLNSSGCLGVSESYKVTVDPRPVSAFTVANTCLGQQTLFSTTIPEEKRSRLKFVWEFSDATVLRGPVVTKEFANAGRGVVKYTVTDTVTGCSASRQETITVNPVPEVSFTASGFCTGSKTSFSANASVLPMTIPGETGSGKIVRYTWDFGDKTAPVIVESQSGENMPISNVEHSFASSGNTDVTLTVESDKGCQTVIKKNFIIFPVITEQVYNENFDHVTNENAWISGSWQGVDGLSSWRLERNDSLGFVWRTSGNNGSYHNSEQSYIESACINFASWENPMMLFEYMKDTDAGGDGAVLLYSIDGGKNWKILGSNPEAGMNWYNRENILGVPGGDEKINKNRIGWSGSSNGYVAGRYSLNGIKKDIKELKSKNAATVPVDTTEFVRFRLAFGSNSDNPVREPNFAGFALNKVQVSNKNRKVLLEHFSNTETASIFTHTQEMIQFAEQESDLVYLEYHLGLPRTANEDPFWAVDKGPQNGRAFRYGIGQAPATMVDGLYLNQQQESFLPKEKEPYNKKGYTNYLRRSLVPSPFDMKIDYEGGEDNTPLKVKVTVKHSKDIAATPIVKGPLYVTIAIVENVIDHNGKQLRHVFRKFLPDAAGTHFKGDWSAEEAREETVEQEWIYSGLPKAGQYSIVAFVQSDRPEPGRSEYGQQLFQIHQAGIKSIDKDLQDLVVSGIREEFSSEDVKLVPNPTSDMYFIRFAKPANVPTEWRVYDQLGKVIEQGVAGSGARELQFSAKEYTQGMYLIYIRQGEKIVQKRLVVVK